VAVYVTIGSPKRGLRHLDLRCAAGRDEPVYAGRLNHKGYRPALAPTWRLGADGVIAYVSNGKLVQDSTDRCGKCFTPGGPLPASRWWHDAERVIAKLPPMGVYELYDSATRTTQIGSGSLKSRVRSRIAATQKSRFATADCIWWLYDLLDAGGKPSLRSLKVDENETLKAAEERWREERRRSGWQVSSDV
jgi:hypothetical protein